MARLWRLAILLAAVHAAVVREQERVLAEWAIASSEGIQEGGALVSLPSYKVGDAWMHTIGPSTVVGAQVRNGIIQNPFFGSNIESINATAFTVPWWFRTTFTAADVQNHNGPTIIAAKGFNYRADVWVNGKRLADKSTVVGSFVCFEFDVSGMLRTSGENALAFLVYPQHDRALPDDNHDTDLGISFIDWAPTPPDNSLGLWREVTLRQAAGPVTVDHPMVATHLDVQASPTNPKAKARLAVLAELRNWGAASTAALLRVRLLDPAGATVFAGQQLVALAARERRLVAFNDTQAFHELQAAVELWWPRQMGNPTLHTLQVSVEAARASSGTWDSLTTTVGLRTVASRLDASGHRLFEVNGRPLLVRGAGWSPDLFLRKEPARVAAVLAYVAHLGLNTVRLEGKMEDEDFFDACDAAGLLVMPGWSCCDAWQHWRLWGPEQFHVARASMTSQARRLRTHPSVLGFFISSDELPPQQVESLYLDTLEKEAWNMPIISSASLRTSNITGPTGVKMSGPYSWVPPNYWLEDPGQWGGAWGFLTEGGPGENPMTLESLAALVPQADLWPPRPDDCWGHCGNKQGHFGKLAPFNKALEARYGASRSAAEYLYKAAAAAYEGHRAMFEGYSRNKYTKATGVIQWMLNTAWPENLWQLFQYDLTPGASYFATRAACEPLHVLYSYDDSSVWIVNSASQTASPISGKQFHVTAEVLALNATVLFNLTFASVPVAADSTLKVGSVATPATMTRVLGSGRTYLVHLRLWDGPLSVSSNMYWLSTSPDVLDWESSTWYNTPCTSFADFTDLAKLPPVRLTVTTRSINATSTEVNIENPSATVIAFLVRVRLLQGSKDQQASKEAGVAPILWSDNFVTIRPGTSVTLTATYPLASVQGPLRPVVETWNDIVGQASGRSLVV